jgi:hypothetical protein
MRPRREGAGQRGFALLLVFAMAAAIAVLIYLEMPRVAFEHQRDKEALLADRGEQFIRAIELYVRKFKKLPQTLDDLDVSQNIRFLRRRYTDPMTGSDEWRLIHTDMNGQYLDSKVHKKAGALDQVDNGPSILASRVQGIGASATLIDQSDQTTSPALQRRASDRISPGGGPGAGGGSFDGSVQPAAGSEAATDSSQSDSQAPGPAAAPPQAPAQGGVFNNPFLPPGVRAQAGAQQAQPGGGDSAGQAAPGASLLSNAPQSDQTTPVGQALSPFSGGAAAAPGGAAGQSGTGSGFMSQPGGLGAPPTPPAIQQIQQILGSQRGGATASGTSASGSAGATGSGGPSALGAGLVGVASKKEQPSIRRYKDQTNYSYWEFVYDPRESGQNKAGAGVPGAPGTAAGASGTTAGSSNPSSSFGGMSGGTPAPAGPPSN